MIGKERLFWVQDQPGSPWHWGVRSGVGVKLEGQARARSHGPCSRENRFHSWGVGRKEGGNGDRWPSPPGFESLRWCFMVWAWGMQLDALCHSFYSVQLRFSGYVRGLIA